MTKTAVIHQPDFLSYLGFFQRFLSADLYIALDCVQFVKNTSKAWQNRDKIKTPQGEKWLTVAIQKISSGTKINEVLLSTSDWRKDHLNLLQENYRQAPYFADIYPYLQELYSFQCIKMMDFNLESINLMLKLFDIKINTILASSLNPQGKNNTLLVDILSKTGCNYYLSGKGAEAYYDPKPFEAAGIKVIWQNFNHPVYPQLHGEFIPYLSAIDLLFNCGIEKSRQILRSS